jgi:trigger factor
MQVTELDSQGLKKNFKIVVDNAKISAMVDEELRIAGEQVKIPGFRPGNIPMKILKQRYGKSVQGDVLKKVINQTTSEVVTEKKLRPAMTPQINIESYEEGSDLTFSMSVESFPDMPEIDFSSITLDRNTFEIEQSDIDEAQERIADQNATFVAAAEGTKAALGNVVMIDFKGMIDGVAFDGGTAEDFDLELGSNQFIGGFEDQLVGCKAGDKKDVKVTFPEQYQAKALAGKPAVFECVVKEVKTKSPAVMDDEFAKARGFESLEKIREAIRMQITGEYNGIVRNQLKKALFDKLEEKCNFELPQSMVDLEFNSIWDRLKEAKASGDESLAGKDDATLEVEYKEIARRRVKLGLLLAEVGNKNKIDIGRDELMRAVVQQANQFPGQEQMVMDFYRKNPQRMEDLRGPILEEKSVDFVLAKVKYNDKNLSLKALLDTAKAEEDASEEEQKPAKKKAAK